MKVSIISYQLSISLPFGDPSSTLLRSFFKISINNSKSSFYLKSLKLTKNQTNSQPRQSFPLETLLLFFCKDTPTIVTNSDYRQLLKKLVSSQPSFSRLGIQASLSALGLSKTFRIAAKAIDLVGNPVGEVEIIVSLFQINA